MKKINYSNEYKPNCGFCSKPDFNQAVDKQLIFCGATTGRGVILLGARDADLQGKTPSRCPRLYNVALDRDARGEAALNCIV